MSYRRRRKKTIERVAERRITGQTSAAKARDETGGVVGEKRFSNGPETTYGQRRRTSTGKKRKKKRTIS